MPDVLMVGSVAYDSVETPLGKVDHALGGAATFAGVAASWFAGVQIVGVVGDDFEARHLEYLTSRGIDLAGLQRVPGKTFHWSGRYHANFSDRDTLATELNVFADFDPVLPAAYCATPYVFLANIQPELQAKVLDQMTAPRFVALDTMNLWIDIARPALEAVIARVDMLLVNDGEARQLTGADSLLDAAAAIRAMGPAAVVIKKGEHGAMLFGPDGIFALPAYPVPKVVDPTGCGDCFAGGMIGWLAHLDRTDDAALRQAMVYGSVVASFNVEDFSLDRQRNLTRGEIDARFAEFRELVRF